QLHAVGRHAAAFPFRESAARTAAVFRDVVCDSTAELQLDVSARAGDRACFGLDVVWKSLGWSRSFYWGAMRADLLDAARVDHAVMGVGWRRARRDGVWPAQSMDE